MSTRASGDVLEEMVVASLKPVDPTTQKTINSGALRGDGDIHTRYFCIDAKHIAEGRRKNIIVQTADLEHAWKQAAKAQRAFGVIATSYDNNKIAITMSLEMFTDLVELLARRDQHISDLEKDLENVIDNQG